MTTKCNIRLNITPKRIRFNIIIKYLAFEKMDILYLHVLLIVSKSSNFNLTIYTIYIFLIRDNIIYFPSHIYKMYICISLTDLKQIYNLV